MAVKQLIFPGNRGFNSNGVAVPWAVCRFYESGTSTPAAVYSDVALTTSLGSFITANGAGRFPVAYQDQDTAFRMIVEDASGTELDDIDPIYFGGAVDTGITQGDADERYLLQAENLSDLPDVADARDNLGINSTNVKLTESLIIACSDETTAITTGTAKTTFRMPYAFTVSAVRASVTTAPTGSTIIIDINDSGTTILSTKLSIDASEKTSTTAASAAVISDASLADDAEITVDFDQVGSSVAGAGVKVYLIGSRT